MKQTKNTAFTLVELIVVITILAVLATVAFISFQGYTSSSRDSVRLADLKNISKSFEFMKTKDQQLPLPDQKVDITASGTIFQYQGVLEEQTLKLSNIHNGGLDPLDGNPYGYAVNAQRNKFQVIGFLENTQTAGNNLLSQSLADNTDKFIKTSGDDLGIILDNSTNEIITQNGGVTDIEVVSNVQDYLVVVNNKKQGTIQSSNIASYFIPKRTCLELLNSGFGVSGIYTIYPDAINPIDVYCDMTTDGGGWTRVMYKNPQVDFEKVENRTAGEYSGKCSYSPQNVICDYNKDKNLPLGNDDFGWNRYIDYYIPFDYTQLAFKLRIQGNSAHPTTGDYGYELGKFNFTLNDGNTKLQGIYMSDPSGSEPSITDDTTIGNYDKLYNASDVSVLGDMLQTIESIVDFDSNNGTPQLIYTRYFNGAEYPYQATEVDYLMLR